MKLRKLMLFIGVFLSGFVCGSGDIPKGTELLTFMTLSFLLGTTLVNWIYRLRSNVRSRMTDRGFRILRYEIRRIVPDASKVIEMDNTSKQKTKRQDQSSASSECDLCEGEDVRTSGGTKIPCPKCKIKMGRA